MRPGGKGQLALRGRGGRRGVAPRSGGATRLPCRRGRGVGVVERAAALADLARIGYCVGAATERVAVAAFQRRFRPERWDGLVDGETRMRLRQVRETVELAQAQAELARRRRYN